MGASSVVSQRLRRARMVLRTFSIFRPCLPAPATPSLRGLGKTYKMRPILLAALAALALQAATLSGRWVGLHRGQTLNLEFYGDTMLVVNDQYPLNYRVTRDSLIATGDTSFAVRYWFSYGRLLLETKDGAVITMAQQGPLARPLTGRWLGELGTAMPTPAELLIYAGGVARWRKLTGGGWQDGEWERESRIITFFWPADSTDWVGHYDVEGNSIVFEHTVPGSGPAIFKRVFR